MSLYIHITDYLEEEILVDVCMLEGKPVKGILGTTLPPNKEQNVKKIEEVKGKIMIF